MNNRLFIAGLPFSTTEDELKALFAQHGNVTSANIITDRETGKSRGFGFVEMATAEEAQNAAKAINNSEYGGRKLVVNDAKPKAGEKKRNWGFKPGGRSFGDKRNSFGGRREGGRGSFGRDRRDSGRQGFRGGRDSR